MFTKYRPGLFTQMLAVEDGEMSQIWISITQLRDIYLNRVVHNKKVVLQHDMRPDFMNNHNQGNESFTLNKAFIPPRPLFPFY